ncbi:MAG: UPF0182 family protein [Actinobacteria bacterium]|nr:UPF0182 family protein [Actinomycetota bacterium]MDA3016912.1 UPF0182 family protein [Actinomycetota bacterium]
MRNPSDLPRNPRSPNSSGGGFRLGSFKKGRAVWSAILAVFVIGGISVRSLANFYVDVLWHNVVGRSDVFWGVLTTKITLSAFFVVIFSLVIFLNLWLADRLAPSDVPISLEQRALAGYRQLVATRQWLVRAVVSLLLGLLVGLPASAQWQDWLLFRNSQSFGVKDPLFNRDVSFYVFKLPFIQFLISWSLAALILIALVTFIAHYLNGAIQLQTEGRRVTPQAKAHVSVLFALIALSRAVNYWFGRFELTMSTRGVVKGATFTDVNAQLPATNLMILVSLAVAALFLWNVWQKSWRLPVLATMLWVVVALVAGQIYPAVVQRFSVQPNVSTKEIPYIERNIIATKNAMGLTTVKIVEVEYEQITAADVAGDLGPLQDVRQLDPIQMRDRFVLDEGQTSYYAIRDLDVDRYEIDGREQQVLVAARELNSAGIPNRTWVSRHLLYTHGCGLIVAPASKVTVDGRPIYTSLKITQPELYFGEGLDSYALVKTGEVEQACSDTKAQNYSAKGGVELSSLARRVAFAVHFGEYNLFGSALLENESQIMFVRNIKDRIAKVAPFLKLDADPYPVVIEGKAQWIVDAFTITDHYPYAQQANIDQLTFGSGLNTPFNYVRNSVKIAVDAYDGSMKFYVVDQNDPIIKTWQAVFPKLFTSVDLAPKELVDHFRYPEDLFRVQTNTYGRYQFEDATLFFNRNAAWSVAQAPAIEPEGLTGVVAGDFTTNLNAANTGEVRDASVARFEPYYTMFHEPRSKSSEGVFSMLRPFVPFSADNARKELRAFMVVSSDPKTYGQLTIYKVDGPLPEGPATVAAEIGSDPVVSQQITLLDQRGSRVIYGDLQIINVSKGLVYVRPLFVRPDDPSAKQIFVRKFLVSYNNRVVMADDLTAAISQVFPGFDKDLGDRVDDGSVEVVPDDSSDSSGGTTATTQPSSGGSSANLDTPALLLARAEELFAQADAALGSTPPDFALYQKRLAEARELVSRAIALVGN